MNSRRWISYLPHVVLVLNAILVIVEAIDLEVDEDGATQLHFRFDRGLEDDMWRALEGFSILHFLVAELLRQLERGDQAKEG